MHFKFFALFTDNLSRNNCIRFTGYLQLHIYENLHSLSILRVLGLFRWGRKNRGKEVVGRYQLKEELINILKLYFQNRMSSQTILSAVKLTNSEKQLGDGGCRIEERCIILIDTN